MATKNLYQVFTHIHNDTPVEGEAAIVLRDVYVIAKNPSHAHNKVVRAFGDMLVLIENIRLCASNDKVFTSNGVNTFIG